MVLLVNLFNLFDLFDLFNWLDLLNLLDWFNLLKELKAVLDNGNIMGPCVLAFPLVCLVCFVSLVGIQVFKIFLAKERGQVGRLLLLTSVSARLGSVPQMLISSSSVMPSESLS